MAPIKPLVPSDWTVELVCPADILQDDNCIRNPCSEGVTALADSIRGNGWIAGSLVIVYRDTDNKFRCLDGMHRVRAVSSLAADTSIPWPSDWKREEGRLLMPCAVLRVMPSPAERVFHSTTRNMATETVVRMSYLNILSVIQAQQTAQAGPTTALQPAPGTGVAQGGRTGDVGVPDKGAIIATVRRITNLAEATVKRDYHVFATLSGRGWLALLEEAARDYGHRWFTRKNIDDLLHMRSQSITLRTFLAWLSQLENCEANLPTLQNKRAPVFAGMSCVISSCCELLQQFCSSDNKLQHTPGCDREEETMKEFKDFLVVHFNDKKTDLFRTAPDDRTKNTVRKFVERRHAALNPPVPRLPTTETPAESSGGVEPGLPVKRRLDLAETEEDSRPAEKTPREEPQPRKKGFLSDSESEQNSSNGGSDRGSVSSKDSDGNEITPKTPVPPRTEETSRLTDPKGPPAQKKRRTTGPEQNSGKAVVPTGPVVPEPPSVITAGSPILSLFPYGKGKEVLAFKVFDLEDTVQGYRAKAHRQALFTAGYTVVPNVIPEVDRAGLDKLPITRGGINELFRYYLEAAEKSGLRCCEGKAPVAVCKDGTNDPSLRYYARNDAFTHMAAEHMDLYTLKIRLDLSAALLLQELGIKDNITYQYRIPKVGGRVCLTAPGCIAQKPHTQFPVRTAKGRTVADPPYFLLQTGERAATLLVWPASHYTCAFFEHMEECESGGGSEQQEGREAVKKAEEEYARALKPQRISIPPYSVFIGRGDLVHAEVSIDAGDTWKIHSGLYCATSQDEGKKTICYRPFGEES